MATAPLRFDQPGLLSGVMFFAVVSLGCAYIVYSKLHGFAALYVTMVPVVIMIVYALLLGLARLFRLRDDQSGDNLYYMGFLFTLTSLAVSLYQFSESGSAEQIVQNFGIAIASTIAGIALRIFFNQMRRDPIEVEHTARLELAEASRKVKRELESTVLEFGYFRRSAQQSMSDALDEVIEVLKAAKDRFVVQLDDFAKNSTKPIEDASKKSGDTLSDMNARIAMTLDGLANRLTEESTHMTQATAAIVEAIDGVVTKLEEMQAPDQVIEIKLSPMIQGLSRAVNTFSKNAEAQTSSIEANSKQTRELAAAIATLITELRAARAASTGRPERSWP